MRSSVAAVCLMASILVTSLASAQATGDSTDATGRARSLVEEGLKRYKLAEYQLAIDAFKEAYLLTEAPELLFNIAQAYRLKGDCVQALSFYRNYRSAAPKAAKNPGVDSAISDMESCVAKATPPAAPPPEPPPPAAQPAAVTPPRHEDAERPTASRVPSAVLTIGGLTVAAAGAGLWVWSELDYASLKDSCSPACAPEETQGPETRRTVGIVLLGAGAAAAAVGAVWYLAAPKPHSPTVSVAPLSRGVRLGMTFSL